MLRIAPRALIPTTEGLAVKIIAKIWAAGVVGLTVVGCGPPEIVPVVPPGIELSRVSAPTEDQKSQAVGEAINSTSAQSAKPQAAPATAEAGSNDATPTENSSSPRTLASGLTYVTLKPGNGTPAKFGQRVFVHYTGTLTNGKVFDSSRDRGKPFAFTIGKREVISGWDQGVAGMKVGERRKLTIPPELGYGSEAQGTDIPANSTLVFDLELMKVE